VGIWSNRKVLSIKCLFLAGCLFVAYPPPIALAGLENESNSSDVCNHIVSSENSAFFGLGVPTPKYPAPESKSGLFFIESFLGFSFHQVMNAVVYRIYPNAHQTYRKTSPGRQREALKQTSLILNLIENRQVKLEETTEEHHKALRKLFANREIVDLGSGDPDTSNYIRMLSHHFRATSYLGVDTEVDEVTFTERGYPTTSNFQAKLPSRYIKQDIVEFLKNYKQRGSDSAPATFVMMGMELVDWSKVYETAAKLLNISLSEDRGNLSGPLDAPSPYYTELALKLIEEASLEKPSGTPETIAIVDEKIKSKLAQQKEYVVATLEAFKSTFRPGDILLLGPSTTRLDFESIGLRSLSENPWAPGQLITTYEAIAGKPMGR